MKRLAEAKLARTYLTVERDRRVEQRLNFNVIRLPGHTEKEAK